MTYANMSNVPTQTAGVSPLLATDWNTYVKDNFNDIKSGHIVVADNAAKTALGVVVEGTMVYQSDNQKLFVYNSGWVEIGDLDRAGALPETSPGHLIVADATAKSALSPIEGMMVYQSDVNKVYVYNGSAWVETNDLDNTASLPDGGTALSVIGNGTNATAARTDLTAGTDGHVLRRSGTALGFGTVVKAGLDSTVFVNTGFTGPLEAFSTRGALTGATNYDVKTQTVLYSNANAAANWTLNVRGDSTTSLNTLLATNQSVTIVLLAQQGSTAYYQTAMTIDGASVTPKWWLGTAPTAGNINATDVYTFNILKTGSAAYTVFASVVKFA